MEHPRTQRELLTHEYRMKELTPRVKLATRLYATGLCKTKAEAARQAGLSPSVFYITSTTEVKVADLMAEVERELADETIDTAKLIRRLGRAAIGQIAKTMLNPVEKGETRLKAAQDLADRSPETSKVINVNAQVATPLSDDQVHALRRSLIEAAELRARFPAAAEGSYVTVSDATTARSLDLVKERDPLMALPSGTESAA